MPTPTVEAGVTLAELVNRHPSRAAIFERLKLDYCCGGGMTLAEACERRGLDPETVCRMIEAFDMAPPGVSEHVEGRDWSRASIGELCDHIVAVHHDGLRRELRLTAELVNSVMRVHGPVHRELNDLPRVYDRLRSELEEHIETEEREVFPACRALDVDEALLAVHEHEHQEVGDTLAALRELTGDYDTSRALCRTHRRLLESLQAIELDLHQHIHEENNVLFPRVRAELAAAARGKEASR